jgi:eukaryotic-like serine/threonine-protein kinase
LIADTAEGLDAAHELRSMSGERIELVHHDISLGNIVVLYNGQVKLVDFGVAKATMTAGPKAKVQGKFSYMAPEKLKGAQGDRRSDIFSLGCVMWEALTLKRLFRGGNDADTMKQVLELPISPPSTINGDVPKEYDEIVMRALDRDPTRRHLTAKEMAVEIEELLRQHGYGAKNDRIAKYMQETFKAHIDARKKLVHEVASKGSASAEVVDAAFDEAGGLASGSPVTPPPGSFATPREGSAPPSTNDFKPLAFDPPPIGNFADLDKPTEISAPAFRIDETAEVPALPFTRADADAGGDTTITTPPTSPLGRLRVVLATRKQRAIAIALAAAFVLIVLAIAFSGSPPVITPAGRPAAVADAAVALATPPADAAVAAVVPDAAELAAVTLDAAERVVPDAAVAVHVEAHPIEHHAPPRPPHRVVPRPPPGPSSQELFQKAFQAFVRGDTDDALATLKTAKASNPSYAPTWRLLGQVYKKLGDAAQARAAFMRYLALAPTAGDAATIRKELE